MEMKENKMLKEKQPITINAGEVDKMKLKWTARRFVCFKRTALSAPVSNRTGM